MNICNNNKKLIQKRNKTNIQEEEDQSALFVIENVENGSETSNNKLRIRFVIPIFSNMQYYLSGDGMLVLHSGRRTHTFDVASVRSLWTLTCSLEKSKSLSEQKNYYPDGPSHSWLAYYQKLIVEWKDNLKQVTTTPSSVGVAGDSIPGTPTRESIRAGLKSLLTSRQNELDSLSCLDIRNALEEIFNQSLSHEKKFIDEQMMQIIGQLDTASEIFENFLYLGNEWNALDIDEIKEKGIGYVCNMAIELDNFFPDICKYCNVPIWDDVEANIYDYLDGVVAFIKSALNTNSKILVHCKMGISRSSSAVIAFAMSHHGWSFEYALEYVRSKRPVVKPNPAFTEQLKKYEQSLVSRKKRGND
eukprot:Pgem_evm1s7978